MSLPVAGRGVCLMELTVAEVPVDEDVASAQRAGTDAGVQASPCSRSNAVTARFFMKKT